MMSDFLLAERRQRHNHRASERRRIGFPKIGHYDTWLIDQLQILVLKNHDHVLYPKSDQNHLCKSMGTKLPFLPFATKEENSLFANLALRNDFPSMSNEDSAAVEWCKYVDGVSVRSERSYPAATIVSYHPSTSNA